MANSTLSPKDALQQVETTKQEKEEALEKVSQKGAGKTYTMEGGNILETDDRKKGLLPRVVDELFEAINLCGDTTTYKIKLSMVEIYIERVRDLFDLSKDNIQIKEQKGHGILLSGVIEMLISDGEEALKFLSSGIANKAVGETQMNMASSRSHCIHIFTVQKELTNEKRVSTGKLVLVDLAGSEKVEKTGAGGRVLEEAKTINKSLSALGNVINALTSSPHEKQIASPIVIRSLLGSYRMLLEEVPILHYFAVAPQVFVIHQRVYPPYALEQELSI